MMKETELSELERELREARAGGSALEARREFRTTRIEQIEERHRGGEGGLAIARAIADTTDAIVLDAYREAAGEAADPAPPHALVALGGYGRREMSPCSDVDLLFLFDREKDKSAGLISGVLHPLWDVGFDIGHGSRTVTESVRMTRGDMESCTAMLDGRFLAGDRELFGKFRKRLFAGLPKKTVNRLAALRRSRKESSGRVQVLEPNVKESAGGLREIHLLEWALKARGGPDLAKVWPRFLDAEDVETLARGPRLPVAGPPPAAFRDGAQARRPRFRAQDRDQPRPWGTATAPSAGRSRPEGPPGQAATATPGTGSGPPTGSGRTAGSSWPPNISCATTTCTPAASSTWSSSVSSASSTSRGAAAAACCSRKG